tara:strand:+ start:1208 stop:2704 length:1497 start_codon:yes stop_codon:yes gene_type:complete
LSIPFGAFLPDQPIFENPGATVATNVVPLTAGSYGPLKALASISAALSNAPQGAAAYVVDGTTHTFAGDAANLFKLNGAAWDEVSVSTGAYTVASTDVINFVQYGDRCISVNGHTDVPQTFLMGTDSAFSNLAGSPPKAKVAAAVKDFVVLGNILGQENRVHWSAIDDPTDWPTIASADAAAKQSDRQDLPTGGDVQAITGAIGGLDGVVFCRKSIYQMQYEGPPAVFSFREIERDRGCYGPNSVINVGNQAFYLGEDGFYSITASGSLPIGSQKVDNYFFKDWTGASVHAIYGAADVINKLAMWLYPGEDNTSGVPDTLIIYNWETKQWSTAKVDASLIFRDISVAYTLDQLDSFGNIDTLADSLDSRIWIGGNILLSVFDSSNKLARFTGPNKAATLETGEVSGGTLFNKPHERVLVNGIRPYVNTPAANMAVTLRHRDGLGASLTDTASTAIAANGMAGFTVSSRYVRARVSISASSSWSHASGLDFDAQEDGTL